MVLFVQPNITAPRSCGWRFLVGMDRFVGYNLAPRGFARHHCTDTSKMRNKRRGINILHYPVACLMHEARKGNVLQESQLVIFYKHESKDQTTVMQIQILQFGIITSFDSAYCTLQFKKTLTCCTLYFQTCFL
jgi:hypothetical protein